MADTLNDLIINGAYAAAPIVDDSYSVEDLVDAGLADKKRKIKERSEKFQARRAERAENEQAAEDFLAEDNRKNQSILGIKTVPNSVVEFGEQGTQDGMQNFGGSTRSGKTADYGQAQAEIEKASQKRDPNALTRSYRVKGDPRNFEGESIYIEDGMPVPERFVRAAKERDIKFPYIDEENGGWRDDYREQPTSARSGLDELARLEQVINSGTLNGPALVQAKEVQRRLELDVSPKARARSDKQAGIDTRIIDKEIYNSDRIKNILQTLELGPVSLIDPRTQATGVVQPGQRESLPYFTNNSLDSIGQISSIGNAKDSSKFNVGEDINRGKALRMLFEEPSAADKVVADRVAEVFGGDPFYESIYSDKDGMPIQVTKDQASDAPLNKTRSWVMDTIAPQLQEEQLKQVDIGKQLAALNQGLSKLKIKGSPVDPNLSNIRSVDDLSNFFNYYVKAKMDANEEFSYRTGDTKTVLENPTVSDLLTIGNTREYAQNDLSRALYQLELARLSSVNELQNDAFQAGQGTSVGTRTARNLVAYPASVFEPGSSSNRRRVNGTYLASDEIQPLGIYNSIMRNIPGGGIELTDPGVRMATLGEYNQRAVNYELERQAQLNPRSSKSKEIRRSVAPLFKVLSGDKRAGIERLSSSELNDAQSSSMGAVSGEGVAKAYFLSKADSKLSPAERFKSKGPNAKFANEIERRSQIADAKREAQRVSNDRGLITFGSEATAEDPLMSQWRERDRQMNANRNSSYTAPSLTLPAGVRATGQTIFGGYEVPRMKVYDDPKFANTQAVQGLQATSAVVNPPTDPIPLAVRGGWMGGPGRGAVKAPSDLAIAKPVMAQKAAPMQEALAGITYNETAPDPWSQPVGTGNGISNEVAKRQSSTSKIPPLSASPPPREYAFGGSFKADGPNSYRTNVRSEADYRQSVRNLGRIRGYGRNAAIAGGGVAALAGIDGLINGERNNREQEMYR